MDKIESLIRRMRWKAFHFENPHQGTNRETYGFKTCNAPPQSEYLKPFECDLYEMFRNLEFNRSPSQFQRQLSCDKKKIDSFKKVLVEADKTSNLYLVETESYNKLLKDNISKTYKKTNNNSLQEINLEAKKIASQLNLDSRIEVYAEKTAYITLKDHKPHFQQDPKCRLINPAKSELGMISKKLLDGINREIRAKTELNQWMNTEQVLEWFSAQKNKRKSQFIKFDIVEFYPSISESLLKNAIHFAKLYTPISDETLNIILHARKSLLFDGQNVWTKRDCPNFDVTMGSYDGAEICELVGLYMLDQMATSIGENVFGLYRDDGLGCLSNLSGPQTDRLRKNITKLFNDNNLKITVETNLTSTDFLDVTLDLERDRYYPYRKPNDEPLYIHYQSNHPPSIIRQLPNMISKRVSDLSSSKELFDKYKEPYNKALEKSGFKQKINFIHKAKKPSRNRPRKITWFNPPFNKDVKTNIGKTFKYLVETHFPKHHRYHKLFNKNNLKLSYSCMPNMGQIINKHNRKLISRKESPNSTLPPRLCNCRDQKQCPLNGQCLQSCLVYRATVNSQTTVKKYIGCTELSFKARYANHKQSFKNNKYRKATALSDYIWSLKDAGTEYTLTWDILSKTAPYSCGAKKCDLCLTEKVIIATSDPETLLNSRAELISKCRHRNKYLLSCLKT